MKLAYFVLVHRYPEQFSKLFKAIYDPNNYYLIHIDKKADLAVKEFVQALLMEFDNTAILESQNVLWGGYSMVDVELKGMDALLKTQIQWDYFINLSGQDYPLRSQDYIRDFLNEHQGADFLQMIDQAADRPDTMNRVENYYCETDDGFSGTPYKRPYLKGVKPYIGGQWMMLSRRCCEFIRSSHEVKILEDFYRNTLIPDESFFQTVIANTSYCGHVISDDKRAIIWIPDGDIKLRPKTFTEQDSAFLFESTHLFARKFDDNIDANILPLIDARLNIC